MELGLNRRNVARLVLVAWAVALAWLARRQFATPSGAAGDPRGNRLAPGAWYYAVYAGGRQVGQLNLSVDTLVDGVRLTEQFVVDVPSGATRPGSSPRGPTISSPGASGSATSAGACSASAHGSSSTAASAPIR